ncbi:MAG: OmpA family protein [Candidatus Deferrimicrobium sp.]
MNHTTRSRIFRGTGILFSFSLLMFFIAGCAPSQKEMMAKDQVARASKAYADAKVNPDVDAYAPMELQDAGKAVQEAQQAKELDDMLQKGYIAERKTQLAMTVADGKAAEREMDKVKVETAQILTQKQSMDAERAKRETIMAQGEAERARREATSETEKTAIAKRQAEQAKQQMKQTLEQMEQAKLAARAEADQLAKEISGLKAQQTERGIVLTIGDVLFATGKANLSAQANVSVTKLAEFLKNHPTRNVLIEGHTDSVGSDEYNQVLSGKRADSVKYELVNDGVEATRITTVGYGEKYPIASNDSANSRAQNRRVDVIILNEGVDAQTQIRK